MEWIEFSLLRPFEHLTCRSYTRLGGVSSAPFESLNLAYGVGDDEKCVAANLERLQESMECDLPVWANQVHGKRVVAIDRRPDSPLDCDGYATNVPGLALMVKHADCQAAIFYDPSHHAIAAVHSGWRSSVENIYSETIEVMGQEYGTDPANLLVCIGPSLGPTAAEFDNYQEELPESFWPFQREKNHFDFWEISRMQLEASGVAPDHIEIVERCTYSEPNLFFSYRRDKATGRHGTIAVLG